MNALKRMGWFLFRLIGGVVLGLGILAGAVWLYAKWDASVPQGERAVMDRELAARKWVRENLADRDAEVTGITAEGSLRGERYFAAQVRGKNAFGGPVANVFVFHYFGSNQALGYRPEQMRLFIDGTKRKLQDADALKLEADYRAMCRAFGVDPG